MFGTLYVQDGHTSRHVSFAPLQWRYPYAFGIHILEILFILLKEAKKRDPVLFIGLHILYTCHLCLFVLEFYWAGYF
jgi:hypothetical protein